MMMMMMILTTDDIPPDGAVPTSVRSRYEAAWQLLRPRLTADEPFRKVLFSEHLKPKPFSKKRKDNLVVHRLVDTNHHPHHQQSNAEALRQRVVKQYFLFFLLWNNLESFECSGTKPFPGSVVLLHRKQRTNWEEKSRPCKVFAASLIWYMAIRKVDIWPFAKLKIGYLQHWYLAIC